jgi:hypothetical protein
MGLPCHGKGKGAQLLLLTFHGAQQQLLLWIGLNWDVSRYHRWE